MADPPALQLDEAPAGEGGAVPGAAPGLAAAVAALGEDDDDLELELAHPEGGCFSVLGQGGRRGSARAASSGCSARLGLSLRQNAR